MRHLSTVLIFDEKNEREMRCKKLLLSFGSSAKTFLKFALLFKYAGAVSVTYGSDGRKTVKVESDAFASKINKYAKDHIKASETGNTETPIFINWLRSDKNDMQCIALLKPFRGGIKDFIVDLMYDVYPLFLESRTLPQLKKNSGKATRKADTGAENKHISETHNVSADDTKPAGNDDGMPDDDIEPPNMRALVDKQLEELNRSKQKHMDLSGLL